MLTNARAVAFASASAWRSYGQKQPRDWSDEQRAQAGERTVSSVDTHLCARAVGRAALASVGNFKRGHAPVRVRGRSRLAGERASWQAKLQATQTKLASNRSQIWEMQAQTQACE